MANQTYVLPDIPKGYERITDLSSATGLTVPSGVTWCRVFVESGTVRIRGDGGTATSTSGGLWDAGVVVNFGAPAQVSIIEETATAVVTVEYF